VATYSPVDVPGAAWTNVYGISRTGTMGRTVEIVGAYGDAIGQHGFLLSGGHFTTLDYPGAVPGTTIAYGVNGRHQIVGSAVEAVSGGQRTFSWLYEAGLFQLRLDCVGASCGGGYAVHGLNNSDLLDGTIVSYGTVSGFSGTTSQPLLIWGGLPSSAVELYGLDDHSPIPRLVGYRRDVDDGDMHGYIPGNSTSFDVPGTTTGTMARGINDTGQMAGSYGVAVHTWSPGTTTPAGSTEPYDHAYAQDGFVYDAVGTPDGRFARIDYPRATKTAVNGITDLDPNSAGGGYYIVGTYKVGTENFFHGEHGFIAHVVPDVQSAGAAAAKNR